MHLTGDPVLAGQPLYSSWASPTASGSTTLSVPHYLGERMVTKDGRSFRYCLNGAVALVAGNVIQAAAQIPNHLALTPVAASIGDTSITVALGATAATANQ